MKLLLSLTATAFCLALGPAAKAGPKSWDWELVSASVHSITASQSLTVRAAIWNTGDEPIDFATLNTIGYGTTLGHVCIDHDPFRLDPCQYWLSPGPYYLYQRKFNDSTDVLHALRDIYLGVGERIEFDYITLTPLPSSTLPGRYTLNDMISGEFGPSGSVPSPGQRPPADRTFSWTVSSVPESPSILLAVTSLAALLLFRGRART